jgi:hypothetical protein
LGELVEGSFRLAIAFLSCSMGAEAMPLSHFIRKSFNEVATATQEESSQPLHRR